MILPNTGKEKGGSFIWQTRPSWVWSYGTEYSRSVDRTGPPTGERFQGAWPKRACIPGCLGTFSQYLKEQAKLRINGNMETAIHTLGYLLKGIRAASLILATAAPTYLTVSSSTKSSVFIRACNCAIAVAMVVLTVYLYLTRR